jgi:phosphoglycolate phosphatase
MALTLRRLAPEPTGLPVYHFAPETAIADILIGKYGEAYRPADFLPEEYSWSKIPVMKVDLSKPSQYLPKEGVQMLIHSHVLEHIPASVDRVISELNEVVAPGGFHVFQVPIHPGWYREDMSPALSKEARTERFYQWDHLRVFGTEDFNDRCLSLFRGFERVDLTQVISVEELIDAEVPPSALTKLTGHTPFVFKKIT